MSTEKTNIETLAEALLALTYTEMMEVGQSLVDTTDGNPFDTDAASDWAGLLAAWATNAVEDPTDDR
jgi:hypothetical protein